MIKKSIKIIGVIFGLLSIPVLIILGFFIFLSSNNKDIETIYVQKIEGSDLLIVDFDVWYGRDGHISGRTLMKSIEDFNFRDIKSLPLTYIDELKSNKINSVELVNYNSEIDFDKQPNIKKEKYANFQISTKYYIKKYKTQKCMLNKYFFDFFTETKDSLFLSGINREYGNNYKNLTDIGIEKGNIKILSDSLDKVVRLEITDLIIMEEGACIVTSYMIPSSPINEDEFSDYGFFKEVKE